MEISKEAEKIINELGEKYSPEIGEKGKLSPEDQKKIMELGKLLFKNGA